MAALTLNGVLGGRSRWHPSPGVQHYSPPAQIAGAGFQAVQAEGPAKAPDVPLANACQPTRATIRVYLIGIPYVSFVVSQAIQAHPPHQYFAPCQVQYKKPIAVVGTSQINVAGNAGIVGRSPPPYVLPQLVNIGADWRLITFSSIS